MKLNIRNEFSALKCVILGQPYENGTPPTLEQTHDAKSYQSVYSNVYPKDRDVISEMQQFENILKKYGVDVIRPRLISGVNQIFSRDVGFVIDDHLVVSNLIRYREDEIMAYQEIFQNIDYNNIINLPKSAHIEGGDVIVHKDYIFIGSCYNEDYRLFKSARTNRNAVHFLQEYFPNKRIIDIDLQKSDKYPNQGALHLDCAFNIVGGDKCIVYKKVFVKETDVSIIENIFGQDNCFYVTEEEMVAMFPNVFSISQNVVVSARHFTRLNKHMREQWGLTVEEIDYREISKMGGLLRCSTLPLVRQES